MALLIGGVLLAAGAIGSLITYATTKAMSDTPTHEHVNTLVNNQFAVRDSKDNDHEFVQNIMITIAIILVILVLITFVLRYVVKRMLNTQNNRRQNTNTQQLQDL